MAAVTETEEADADLARRVATRLGMRWRQDWRELLGIAWEAVRAARLRGVDPRFRFRAGVLGTISRLRVLTHRRRKNRPRFVGLGRRGSDPGGGRDWSWEPEYRPPPSPEQLRWEYWCDTRRARAPLDPYQRLVLALYWVEDMTVQQIASTFGVVQSAVFKTIVSCGVTVARSRMGVAELLAACPWKAGAP